MSRKTQRYSKEFKAEAVRTVLENQLSISEGASRLSLPEGTLGQWVTAARKGLGTPGSRTVAELESEILQQRILHRSRWVIARHGNICGSGLVMG
ncbi:transposase family protein [Escherichia coli P0298942.12]|nr:transposase family protein [Escherichia coli P0298942.12]